MMNYVQYETRRDRVVKHAGRRWLGGESDHREFLEEFVASSRGREPHKEFLGRTANDVLLGSGVRSGLERAQVATPGVAGGLRDDNQQFVANVFASGHIGDCRLRWATTERGTGDFGGWCCTGIKEELPPPNREVVYARAERLRNQRYATQAVGAWV